MVWGFEVVQDGLIRHIVQQVRFSLYPFDADTLFKGMTRAGDVEADELFPVGPGKAVFNDL